MLTQTRGGVKYVWYFVVESLGEAVENRNSRVPQIKTITESYRGSYQVGLSFHRL